MGNILDKVNSVEDLRKLNNYEQEALAGDIRKFIINNVSKTGGHLAPSLGTVELTLALHSVFNTPKDKIIWDVGHQTYTHKILTGRKDKFNTLRTLKGISGFPKSCESEFDAFDTGHSSTSISVALGMARSRDILKRRNNVVAVIGDGALTGGMALEALNDAGASHTKLIVVLNDNEMSISKNVGGLSRFLSILRTKKLYTKSNLTVKAFTRKIPYIGKPIIKLVDKTKHSIKQLIIPNMYFENIGFTYLGPIDGHNLADLKSILRISKRINGPVLVHCLTKKGKGYSLAEKNPDKFHGVSPFNVETGELLKESSKDYSKVFGDKLVELAKKDKKIVAITAAMADGTGLKNFSREFPQRFFDVGIAEQHAITMAAGMAKVGMKPVVSLYSSFLQRAYDQMLHDVCIGNLPVTVCIDRAGIVGSDGETHQGIFDLSFLSHMPNLNIMAPKDYNELENMLEFAVNSNLPMAIRYPRGACKNNILCKEIELGKAEILKDGIDLTIVAIGKMVQTAVEIADRLDMNIEVINARFLKPLDKETILKSVNKTKKVVTIEDNILKGGLASAVREILPSDVIFQCFGYPDKFIEHGNTEEIEKLYGLDVEKLCKIVYNIK